MAQDLRLASTYASNLHFRYHDYRDLMLHLRSYRDLRR